MARPEQPTTPTPRRSTVSDVPAGTPIVIEIAQLASETDLVAAKALFVEYADSLDFDLEHQGFSAELAGLPGSYSPPGGRLLVARVDGEVAGCVASRSLSRTSCEMKRLFVRPRFRGLGLGKQLALALIEAARCAGYREMFLDTHPSMKPAQELYRALGFRETAPYSTGYLPGTLFYVSRLAP